MKHESIKAKIILCPAGAILNLFEALCLDENKYDFQIENVILNETKLFVTLNDKFPELRDVS